MQEVRGRPTATAAVFFATLLSIQTGFCFRCYLDAMQAQVLRCNVALARAFISAHVSMPTLDWLNRAQAFTTAPQVPYRLLEPVSSHGSGPGLHDNLLIQGDNLEALKALLPFYRGQVKCIFIDPPYNTKSAFEHYDDNLEHSQWLSMMLPRLQLLRDLLCEDGSIWVTIDDNEGHYLKVLMDEVFGRRNFVLDITWHRKVSPANDAKFFSTDNDHVLVYAKIIDRLAINRLERSEKNNAVFKNPDNDARGAWNSVTLTGNKTKEERPNLYFKIIGPLGQEVWPPDGLTWRSSPETYAEMAAQGLIYWGKDGSSRSPRIKRFSSEAKPIVPRSLWHYDDVGHTQEAMLESKKSFGQSSFFGTPKPERLLKRVLDIATNPGDLVLDSFLGSGTTAAVAHKMGRHWIGIEMGEHAATHCQPRLQKVINGEQGGISAAVGWQGGGGFGFLRLGAPIFDADGCIHPEVRFATLAAFVWQQETSTAFDPRHHGQPGTPYLGTYAVFDNPPAPIDPAEVPAAPVLRSRTAYYLLFNGILGDKRPASGNVLTLAVLDELLALHARTAYPQAPLVVYGEASRLGEARLALARVTFKHIPYDVKAR